MKFFLSINDKFFENNVHFFIQKLKLYDKNNYVSGFEICFDFNDTIHHEFIEGLISYCKKDHYIIQFHGNSSYELKKQYAYLNFINEISNKLGYKINIVLHPIVLETEQKSLEATNIYFSNVLNYIYNNNLNINISIENLTSKNKNHVLSPEFLEPILANNLDLYYTYDLGHEFIEYGNIINLNDIVKKRLINVHLHTFNNNFDHLPILNISKNKDKWLKAILYLKNINYKGPLVLEYDFYLMGQNYEERLLNYINSIYFLNDYIK